MSGKTELAKVLARNFTARKTGVLVHDKFWSDWGQDENPELVRVTDNDDEFIEWVKTSQSCALFVDEAPETCGRTKENEKFVFLGTQSRHWGHRAHFISQGLTQINPKIRSQCENQFVFALTKAEADKLFKETGEEMFLKCADLRPGQFFKVAPFSDPQLLRIF